MIDGVKRDAMVGYVEADEHRLKIVRELEMKSTSIPTHVFCDMFWSLKEKEVIEILKDIEEHGIIEAISYKEDYPEVWDLTIWGREILFALERPVVVHKWGLSRILKELLPKTKAKIRKLFFTP